LKQTEIIRSEKLSELADAHRQNSSRGSCSGDHHCCACDACWAHMSLPELLIRPRLSGDAALPMTPHLLAQVRPAILRVFRSCALSSLSSSLLPPFIKCDSLWTVLGCRHLRFKLELRVHGLGRAARLQCAEE